MICLATPVDMATPVPFCWGNGSKKHSQSKELHSALLCAIIISYITQCYLFQNNTMLYIIPCHGTYISDLKVHKGSHPTCYMYPWSKESEAAQMVEPHTPNLFLPDVTCNIHSERTETWCCSSDRVIKQFEG